MLMVRRYLAAAFRDCGRMELRRLLPTGAVESAVFDNAEALLAAAQGPGNWYVTLNRPRPDAVGPFRDADIERIVRLPFDFDPERPKGTNSTAEELAFAERTALNIGTLLRSFGWPSPARGMSGNGHHLLYRCSLPNDDTTRASLRRLYSALHERCTLCDPTVRNPSRIFRLYGTVNRKGPDTPARPQRRATVWVPDRWDVVRPETLTRAVDALAPLAKPRAVTRSSVPFGRGDYRTLDAVAMFQAHGKYRRDLGSGKHAVVCPWIEEHTTHGFTDTVLWERGDSGWPTFHCSHAHCHDRKLLDVLRLFGDADRYCAEVRHG